MAAWAMGYWSPLCVYVRRTYVVQNYKPTVESIKQKFRSGNVSRLLNP